MLEIEHEWVFEKTRMQKCKHSSTRGVCTALPRAVFAQFFHARCLQSSFEFSQTFMNVLLLDENKERKLVLSFIIYIFLFHSVFIIVFSKNIRDSVKLTSVIFDSE